MAPNVGVKLANTVVKHIPSMKTGLLRNQNSEAISAVNCYKRIYNPRYEPNQSGEPMRLATLLCTALLCSTVLAQAPKKPVPVPSPSNAALASTTDLPVKRVVLYKNGVGYFEHAGKVRGTQEMRIQFTTGQLNDVLKSLTVVDLGGGQITGVRYDSIAPLSERLSTLRVQLGENTNRVEFLRALRGARVDVRSGTTSASGRLLSVETVRRETEKGLVVEATQFGVMTDGGELRTFELNPATSVRIAEPELNREIGQYLNAVSSMRAKDVRRMNFTSVGSGDRDVFVSYISEVPVWKSTYRIVMPKDTTQKPLLQGWAIIDNTVGEDWKDVQLSLVAGAPQSFIQRISQPYYFHRPTIEMPEQFALMPQTHEGSLNAPAAPPPSGVIAGSAGGMGGGVYRVGAGIASGGVAEISGQVKDPQGMVVAGATVTVTNDQTGAVDSRITDSNGYYYFNGLPSGSYTVLASAQGFRSLKLTNRFVNGGGNRIDAKLDVGAVEQTVEVSAARVNSFEMSGASDSANSYIAKRSAGVIAEAEGKAIGDLFEYAIKQKITVNKNQSALVPIVQSRIEADKVTLWTPNEDEEQVVPLRSLWLKNTSGLTLDSGTFNIIEGDSFAGEGLIDELHPDERRLISYAADTAVRVETEDDSDMRPVTHLRIAKGVMKYTREQRETKTYTIRNSDTTPRVVVIEHPARDGWKFANDAKPEESTASFHRFRVNVDPSKTGTLVVEEFHPEETTYALSNLNSDQILLFTQQKALKPALEAAFNKVMTKKAELTEVQTQLSARRLETQRISGEQARLRENMKALKGSSEEKALLQRYVQNLNQQEDRLAVLNREINDMDGQVRKLNLELNEMVQSITFDEDL
jgi:hypothetical protein